MEMLTEILPIVIDVLLVVFLTVCIIIGIKCIYIMDKAKAILNNVEEYKRQWKEIILNALFSVIDLINSKISLVTEKVAGALENLIQKFFKKKERELDEEAELEEILKEERND